MTKMMEGCMVRSGEDDYVRGKGLLGILFFSLIVFLAHLQMEIS